MPSTGVNHIPTHSLIVRHSRTLRSSPITSLRVPFAGIASALSLVQTGQFVGQCPLGAEFGPLYACTIAPRKPVDEVTAATQESSFDLSWSG